MTYDVEKARKRVERTQTVYFARGDSSDVEWIRLYVKSVNSKTDSIKIIESALVKNTYVTELWNEEDENGNLKGYASLFPRVDVKKDSNGNYRVENAYKYSHIFEKILHKLITDDIIRLYNIVTGDEYSDLTEAEKLTHYQIDEELMVHVTNEADPFHYYNLENTPETRQIWGLEKGLPPGTKLPKIGFRGEEFDIPGIMSLLSYESEFYEVAKAYNELNTLEDVSWGIAGVSLLTGLIGLALGGVPGLVLGAISLGAASFASGVGLYQEYIMDELLTPEQRTAMGELEELEDLYGKNAAQWRREGEKIWGGKVRKREGRDKALKIDKPALREREYRIHTLIPELLDVGLVSRGWDEDYMLKEMHKNQEAKALYQGVDNLAKILFGQPNPLFLAYDVLKEIYGEVPIEAIEALNSYIDQSYWRMVPNDTAARYWATILGVDLQAFLAQKPNERVIKFKEGQLLEDPWISKLQTILWDMAQQGVEPADFWSDLQKQGRTQAKSEEPAAMTASMSTAGLDQLEKNAPLLGEGMEETALATAQQTQMSALAAGQIGGDGQAMPYVRQLADEGVGGMDLSEMQVSYSADTAGPPPVLGTPGGPAAPASSVPSSPGGGGYAAAASSAPGGPKVQSQDIASQLKAPLIQETQLARVPDTDRYFEPPADTAAAGSYSPGVPGGFSLAAGGPGYGAYGQQGTAPQIVYRFDPGSIIIKKQDINEQQAEKLVTAVLQKHSRVAGPAPATAIV